MAPRDAEAGLNLMSEAARGLYDYRRQAGWGVDPFRVQSIMTSSQALLINFFGPLLRDPLWLADWLGVALGGAKVLEVLQAEVEFAPKSRSAHLNDMTMVDFFVAYRSSEGIQSAVFEFKYSDRFSSRKVEIAKNPNYVKLLESRSLWRSEQALLDHRFNQLARCHALATSIARHGDDSRSVATLVVVAPDIDNAASNLVSDYRLLLADADNASLLTLDAAISAAAQTAPNLTGSNAMRLLWDRYAHLAGVVPCHHCRHCPH